jgi:hypothetical protein
MDGHYQMKSMPFGLTNDPAVMQTLIDLVLLPFKSFALAYMDDIVIFSTNFEEHLRHVAAVLDALRQHSLVIKPSKCRFNQPHACFLGFVITTTGLSTDPAYIRTVTDFPVQMISPPSPKR